MDIHYDYVHWINMYMGLCITRNEMIIVHPYNGMYIEVQWAEQVNFGHKTATLHQRSKSGKDYSTDQF